MLKQHHINRMQQAELHERCSRLFQSWSHLCTADEREFNSHDSARCGHLHSTDILFDGCALTQ